MCDAPAIVYLMTLVLIGPQTELARAVLLTQADCETLAARMVANNAASDPHALAPIVRCDPVPMVNAHE
jgi:hypothetical protein